MSKFFLTLRERRSPRKEGTKYSSGTEVAVSFVTILEVLRTLGILSFFFLFFSFFLSFFFSLFG